MSVSFGFKKKIESKVVANNEGRATSSDDIDYLKAVEGKVPVSHAPKPKNKTELVIPLIKKNVYRLPQANSSLNNIGNSQDSLEEEAAKEIIRDSRNYLENVDDQEENFDNLAIPLLLKNKVPSGYETDERLDVSLRPDGATEAQYDQIPVGAFGMAMLRGMGFNPEVGIGKTFKQNTKMLEQKIRPKGLGLGADVPSVQLSNGSKLSNEKSVNNGVNDDNTLALIKGANVLVHSGTHKNKYGVVLGIDMETDRCVIKTAIGGSTEQIGSNCLRVVSKREYDRNAKDLSRLSKAYTGQTTTIIESGTEESRKRHDEREKRGKTHNEGSSEPEEKRHKKEKSKRTKNKEKKHETHRKSPSSSRKYTWARPQMRVRIIDKKYCKGRYYKEKVVIEDVIGEGTCCCKTEDGKILDDITDSMLETVIPRSTSNAYVIIVNSQKRHHNGKLAKILEKDKDKCHAILQLIEDRDIVLKVAFEDMCEFTGDPELNAMF